MLKDKLYGKVKEITRFGSFTRNTILPRKYDPNSDVDLIAVFKTDSGRMTPGTCRRNILDVISTSYPLSYVKKDFPTVKLELNHIMFDVVPAYCEEGWSTKSYYIPDRYDSWRITTPNDLNKDLERSNQSYGNNIVRNVIRLCKHWNAGANYPFDSYEMEKWIVNRYFYSGDNLYDKFLSVLSDLASDRAGVREALNWIREYKGTWSRDPNEQKQLQWLQILLPGLK